ncbi:Hypothetical protein FKW44_003479 [Caligus rogercresseyi]|uniref:Uncharacterized protein n=1 Tax=Caligus rogercresseyi TaxID=217165 RepID=A0A7T8QX45_CALRO|nr:Hypothetical protein FKW44_003479 [Caligus rogercresseyi]
MVLATSLAAASVLADLRDSKLFHTDTAWDANVSVPPLNGHATEDVDLVGLFGVGKTRSPMGFLAPHPPSLEWKHFQVSTATAMTVISLREGIFALLRRSSIRMWSRFLQRRCSLPRH